MGLKGNCEFLMIEAKEMRESPKPLGERGEKRCGSIRTWKRLPRIEEDELILFCRPRFTFTFGEIE